MSQTFFISDLHIGHRRVIEFHDRFRAKSLGVDTIEEHDEKIYDLWSDTIRPHDTVFVLGDVGYDLSRIKTLPGFKKLLLGNHDERNVREYLNAGFRDVVGCIKFKQHWLSHFPIHESELWDKPVIHGHTHSTGVANPMYINVSVEMTRGYPISFGDIRNQTFTTHDKVNKAFEDVIW